MGTGDKLNILMVDDQPAKLLTYEVILKELGENLIRAASGKEALEQLLKHDVAVVLMDVSMPDMDGFELASRIRNHPRFQQTAIIFISAIHLTDLDRIHGYQRGAVDYISVPVVPELLRAKVSVFAELHRKTRELDKRVKELEAIMRVLPVGVEVAHDRACNFVTHNAALDEIQGIPEGVAPHSVKLYQNGRPLAPSEFPLQRVISTRQSVESVELELHKPDGSIAHLLASARPVLDEKGEVHGAVAAFHDITARKSMEQALRDRADLLDLAYEAIMARDLEGNVVFWNSGAESLYGWNRQEAAGRKMHSLLSTKFPVSQEEIQEALESTGTWAGNVRQRTKNGGEIVVACRKAMDRDRKTVLEISRDITSDLKVAETLRKTELLAAMGKVAGVVAHEINNPLEALTNTFYLLRDHPSLDEQARSLAALSEQELARIARIIRQTLGFYRESREPIPLSITDIVDDVLNFESRMLRTKRIMIAKRYEDVGLIHGFPGELKQVFLNLINNAMQAMPEGGRLRIRVQEAPGWRSRNGNRISIFITDTGVGIRPDQAKHLFEPFFTTKSIEGTGLGLWISRGIIQKHEGTISFRSMRFGSQYRTCFLVSITGLKSVARSTPDRRAEAMSWSSGTAFQSNM